MIDYALNRFLITYSGLTGQRCSLHHACLQGGGPDQLNDSDRALLRTFAVAAVQDCRNLGLNGAATIARTLLRHLSEDRECTIERASTLVDSLTDLMHDTFGKERFVFVPSDRQRFFEQDNLFRFPRRTRHPFTSVRADIRSAGTCLALDLNTAAVYHAMRVAEIGLRALARHPRVRITNSKGKKQPVEWEEWQTVLREIESAIEQKYPQSGATKKTKAANREFYRGLLAELQGFKDMYRNHVMHVRKDYTFPVAHEAVTNVGAFMRRLSTRVRE